MTTAGIRMDATVRAAFGAEPRWRSFVPGRLEVFGKHTDYAGGRSLVCAVPRGFSVAALPATDRTVRVIDVGSGERFDCPVADPVPGTSRWHRYVATVVRRLASNFPGAELATRIAFASDLPPASGISSSSALVIAIAEALIARSGLETSERWRAAIHGIEDRVSYFGCIENGASFGPLAGDAGVGTHGGSEDHAAIVMSRAGDLHLFSFSPLRLVRRIPMPPGWTFVVASSGVRASKTGPVREAYNRLAADAAAIRGLAVHGAAPPRDLEPRLRARLEHLIAEDARVAAAADAFAHGDIPRIGQLAGASQRDAARVLGNQIPETIDLVTMAHDLGATAASAFGAGWGGSVWALVRSADASSFLEQWLRTYRTRYASHGSDGFVAPPGDGFRMLRD